LPLIEIKNGQIPQDLNPFDNYQVYNCLDSCITAQLVEPMIGQASPNHLKTYAREMRLQSLCLEMSSKGFPVNKLRMLDLIKELDNEAARALSILHRFCDAVYAAPLNPNSTVQVPAFFYDHLRLPVIWKYDYKTKTRKRGADRDALEKLRAMHPSAVPFVNAILAYRQSTKLSSVFKKGLEPDGRLRCNFSPSGTETGRLSSQANPYGRGTNAQNLNDRVRQVIEAKAGFSIVYIDLKTAESFAVGYIIAKLTGDRAYIDACAGGDLHTGVAQMTWQGLGWEQGNGRHNRSIADRIFYRDFSYRDMAKRGGHATNYYGQPRTVSMHLKVPIQLIEDFQSKYFAAFPGIPIWHLDTIARIQREGSIVTALGRERRFWGRSSDAATHREAIAFEPQSIVADVMNEGLMQVQAWLIKEKLAGICSLLAQVHDAGVFEIKNSELKWIIPELLNRIVHPVDFGAAGIMSIPADVQVGKRWCKWKNKPGLMDGLRDWKAA
jgi:DNA polymerase I-like protein with 3'-5' exonuclease and polymerase domains